MQEIYIGAHIKKQSGSITKTIEVIQNSNGNALQLFVSNPMSATLPNMKTYQNISSVVKKYCKAHDFKLGVHASYTINLAKEPKLNKRTLELKDCYWIDLLLHELIVADLLGAIGVVVHVGKHTSNSKHDGLKYMHNAISYVIQKLNEKNIHAKLIIETPAGMGTELLVDVHEFINFYNSFTKEEKQHLGICIDTAHVWSAGYDVNEYYKIMSKENAKDIVVIHYNNSKTIQGSHVDAHEVLSEGQIPTDSLLQFVTNLQHNPMIILETPSNNLKKELHWIKSEL